MYAFIIVFISLTGAPPTVSEATVFRTADLCWGYQSMKQPVEQERHPGYKLTGYCVPVETWSLKQ